MSYHAYHTGIVTLLRASFLYTHKLGGRFDFLTHVLRSLEDDLSHVVGLSIEFWLVIIIFILVAGPYGYPVMPFTVLCAAVLIPTNTKLAMVIRSVVRQGGASRLSSGVFWLNKPRLLLVPIKLCLFICAYIYASFIFFAWQFSSGSCPFYKDFYPDWALPWWTIIIFNTIIFLHMAAVTLPAYSLAVQMGSDIKSQMLPQKMAKKLMAMAYAAKLHVKRQKEMKSAVLKSPNNAGTPSVLQREEGEGSGGIKEADDDAACCEGKRESLEVRQRSSQLRRVVSGLVERLLRGHEHH